MKCPKCQNPRIKYLHNKTTVDRKLVREDCIAKCSKCKYEGIA